MKILLLLIAGASADWVLTFEDDFSGNALNTSSWTVANRDPTKSQYDGHDAMFVSENVAVSDGNLIITTYYAPNSTLDGVTYNMLSGWIDTQQKRNQTILGSSTRYEASIHMPNPNATGAWPAWWLLPEGLCWPISGEVDIVEWWAGEGHQQKSHTNLPISAAQSYHYGYSCGGDVYNYAEDTTWFPSLTWNSTDPIIDFSTGFHVFGVEINATSLRYYTDNYTTSVRSIPTLCVTNPGFEWGQSRFMPWAPMYGILNVAVSGGSDQTWWKEHNVTTTLVDWVKFWTFEP